MRSSVACSSCMAPVWPAAHQRTRDQRLAPVGGRQLDVFHRDVRRRSGDGSGPLQKILTPMHNAVVVGRIGTGSLHALAGVAGMMFGGILYALTFPWVAAHILPVGDIGKMTLDQLLGIPSWAALVILIVGAGGVFDFVHKLEKSRR